MKLITQDIFEKLLKNGQLRAQQEKNGRDDADFLPAVKLFTPDAGATWLLTEIDPEDSDISFGLCDLGLGFPELGSVRISEIASVRGRFGLPAERDRHFSPAHTLSVYAEAARSAQAITENPEALACAAESLAEQSCNERRNS